MAEKEVRKTTTKKAVRRTTTKTVSARTQEVKTAVAPRKAPVRVQQSSLSERRSPKVLFVGIFIFLVMVGISVGIGLSDKGQVDVAGAITERKQRGTPEEQEAFKTVPVQQNQNNVPNGGLVGTGQSEPVPVVVPPVATTTPSTASSTIGTASSTEETLPPPEAPEEPDEAVSEVTP